MDNGMENRLVLGAYRGANVSRQGLRDWNRI